MRSAHEDIKVLLTLANSIRKNNASAFSPDARGEFVAAYAEGIERAVVEIAALNGITEHDLPEMKRLREVHN